jgi:hypothetical protein
MEHHAGAMKYAIAIFAYLALAERPNRTIVLDVKKMMTAKMMRVPDTIMEWMHAAPADRRSCTMVKYIAFLKLVKNAEATRPVWMELVPSRFTLETVKISAAVVEPKLN